jgi:adenylyltransferase/sulfurtransferase
VCSTETLATIRRLSAPQLRQQMAGSAVIDVREPREYAVAHLPGAINIPVGDLSRRLADIPDAQVRVFVCRSGARSLTAAGIAATAGLDRIAHLEGGLLAWAKEVDAAFEVAAAG